MLPFFRARNTCPCVSHFTPYKVNPRSIMHKHVTQTDMVKDGGRCFQKRHIDAHNSDVNFNQYLSRVHFFSWNTRNCHISSILCYKYWKDQFISLKIKWSKFFLLRNRSTHVKVRGQVKDIVTWICSTQAVLWQISFMTLGTANIVKQQIVKPQDANPGVQKKRQQLPLYKSNHWSTFKLTENHEKLYPGKLINYTQKNQLLPQSLWNSILQFMFRSGYDEVWRRVILVKPKLSINKVITDRYNLTALLTPATLLIVGCRLSR